MVQRRINIKMHLIDKLSDDSLRYRSMKTFFPITMLHRGMMVNMESLLVSHNGPSIVIISIPVLLH